MSRIYRATHEKSRGIFSGHGPVIATRCEAPWLAGFIGQTDGVIGRGRSGLNFGIRFTSLPYEADGVPSIQANGAGLFVGGMF